MAAPVPDYQNVYDIAIKAGQFNIFLEAAEIAGIRDLLETRETITVFAPTDKAFTELPPGKLNELLKSENKETLKNILNFHITMGIHPYSDIPALDGVFTLAKKQLSVQRQGNNIYINGAEIINPDIQAENGIIHAIDKVLLPE